MQRTMVVAIILACSLVGAGCMSERYTQHARNRSSGTDTLAVMTKQDVIALAKAKVGDDVILNQIKTTGARFQLSARDIVDLSNGGVSTKVIDAIIKTEEPSDQAEASGGPYYYPAGYWYVDDPFWDPWYPPVYYGFSVGYYRSFPGYHGFYGGAGFHHRH